MLESNLSQKVIKEFESMGFFVHNPTAGKFGKKGYPDLTILKNSIGFCIELKVNANKLSKDQEKIRVEMIEKNIPYCIFTHKKGTCTLEINYDEPVIIDKVKDACLYLYNRDDIYKGSY